MDRIKIAAAGFALAVTALIVPAAVYGQSAPITVEGELERPVAYVSYADIDLASDSGLKLLRGRVRGAATRLCIHSGTQPIKLVMDGRACFAEAIAGAEEQIALAAIDRGTRFASNASIAVRGARLR